MEALPVLGSLFPLAVAALLIWFVVRAGRHAGWDIDDPAAAVRRFFLYGLFYVTIVVAAQGLVWLAEETLGDDIPARSSIYLAQALAYLVVGLPVAVLLGIYVNRRLRSGEDRRSLAWMIYLTAILITSTVSFMLTSHSWLSQALDPAVDRAFETDQLIASLVWLIVWAVHWFHYRSRYGVTGDLELATGTVAGLLPLAFGLGGLLWVAFDGLYNRLAGDPEVDRNGPTAGSWAAVAAIATVVWVWYWVLHYRKGPRTELWYATVVPGGALAGFAVSVAGIATIIYTTGVWLVGEPEAATAVRHFDQLPAIAAVAVVGLTAWAYHRSLISPSRLGISAERNDPIRAYDYLLSLAALVAVAVGLVLMVSAALSVDRPDVVNTVIAGVTMAGIGIPLWLWFWRRISSHINSNTNSHRGKPDEVAEPNEELQSPLRRIYLFVIFGVGGLAVLLSVLFALTGTFEDLLEGNLSRLTLDDNRVSLAVAAIVSGIAWYHFRVFRAERRLYRAREVQPPGPPTGPPSRQVVLVAPGEGGLARNLAEASGSNIVHWQTADSASRSNGEPDIDLVELERQLSDQDSPNVLVLVHDGQTTVVPFQPDHHGT